MNAVLALLAVLSVWDYPARQPRHDALRRQFVAAVREGDTAAMEETSRRGMERTWNPWFPMPSGVVGLSRM